MNGTTRRKQLALIFCCGFAGLFAGAASAQSSAPLRVDPVLLGLPPVAPEEAPKPAAKPEVKPAAPEEVKPKAEEAKPKAEVRPVEPPVVETRPVAAPPATPKEVPAATAVPAAPAPAEAVQQRQESQKPVVAPAAEARKEAAKPAPVASGSTTSALGPLRVDPALLGLPPAAPATAVAARTAPSGVAQPGARTAAAPALSRDTLPPVVAATGPRDEDEVPDAEPALALRTSRRMDPPPKDSAEPRPAFLSAQRVAGEVNRELNAEGDAELRKIGTVVNADRLTYWPLDDEIEAEGNVRLQQGEDVVSGPKARLRLEEQVGFFEQPSYVLKHESLTASKRAADRNNSEQRIDELSRTAWWNSGFATLRTNLDPQKTKLSRTTESRGEAERLNFEGENQFRLLNNSFTTCPVGNDDWYLKTEELQLDYDREEGEGKKATIYFKDVPFLYSPWISFSLNNERKSGLLTPSFSTNSRNGFEYEQPYYWNIAPNMDATISPRLITKRGVMLKNEFRYLNAAYGGLYNGRVEADVLPGDRQRDGDNRYSLSWQHNQTTASGFTGLINYNRASDDTYFTDMSSSVSGSSTTQLLQQGMLTYGGGGWWNASINFQQYQTLQPDKDNPVLEQYRMLPQITLNARKPDFVGTDLSFLGQFTNFTIRKREQFGTTYPDGVRTVLYPQIALPYVTPGWYVTPKFGVNYRSYSLSGQTAGVPGSMSVTLPVFSVDSGMTFERTSNWFGRDYTQTLEPRLYYVNIPYRDQSQIPLFDTGLADFNFAQIFSENQFSGWDRVNNANQLTAALTSRLIEPASGNEVMRGMIGQRFYFSRNKVALSGTATSSTDKWDRSDFLASFSGQVLPRVYADTALQIDVTDQRAKRYSVGVRYQPEPGKVLNAAYRFNRDATAPIDQVDISGQWPLSGRWHAVGRYNYSFKDDGTVLSSGAKAGRVIESIAGLEYDGGCWILRGVMRRQALTSAEVSTSFFIQLELSGLGRIGTSPLNLLKRSIQGYGLINDPESAAVFED